MSPAYEEMWGRARKSVYDEPHSWTEAVHPEDRTRVNDALEKLETTGAFNQEFRIVRPDGSVRWVHNVAFPIRNETGQVFRIGGVAEDITERKRAEDELKSFAGKLERSNRALEEFASVAAHDMQEPLRKIQTFGGRIKIKHQNCVGEDGLDYLERNARGRGTHGKADQ